MFFHLYPESYTLFSSPHFSRSNDARISSKLHTLSTDSVTKFLVAKIESELKNTVRTTIIFFVTEFILIVRN